MALVCNVAWAQTSSWFKMGASTTSLSDGDYVLVAKSDKGTGPVFYDPSVGKPYRYDVSKTVAEGHAVQSKYVWTIDETTIDGVQHITVTNHDDNTKAFPVDGAKNLNFTGSGTASLKTEMYTADGVDYIVLTLDNEAIGYVHANAPGGNPCLSYWPTGGDGASCIKFTFFPVVVAEEEELAFTLTDLAGNTYTGTYQGVAGVTEPTITGVAGYTLADKAWNGANFTATINFPFAVSSAEVINPTMIANGASWSNPNSRKWHAVTDNGTDYVKVQTSQVQASNANEWLWAIYPELNNGTFTFKIKSIAKGTYVTAKSDASGESNDVQGKTTPVTLTSTGTAFTYNVRTGSNYHFSYTNSSEIALHPSMNGENNTDVFLGVYSGGHSGNDVCFPDPMANTDFGFPTSTEANEEEVFISPFNKGFKYYVSGTDVKATTAAPDANTIANYVWAIYPTLGENGFTFKIKHVGTGKYLYTTSTSNQHAQGVVTVEETATEFSLGSGNSFKHNGAYLSTNSSSSADQFAGTWTSTHNGTGNTIYTAIGENTYTLTDAVGNEYTGTYSGYVGISEPTFTGVEYTLTNKVWNDNHFTATIEFNGLPFPISKPGEEDWTFIKTQRMSSGTCYIYTNGDNVVTKSDHSGNPPYSYLPTVNDIEKWQWAIYPSLRADGKIAFKIKNRAADKFLGKDNVTLIAEGADFQWVACIGNGYGFSSVDNSKFFSANSSDPGEKAATLWGKTGSTHKGANLEFPATSYTITTDAAGYSALYTSVPVTTSIAAYSGKLNDAKTELSLKRIIGTIPANTGVILKGEASAICVLTEAEDVEPLEDNDLTGSSESVTVNTIEGVAYTMQTAGEVTTFQKCTEETIAGGQTYLVLPAESEDRTITLQLPTDITYIVDKLNGPLYRDDATNQNWNKVWKSTQEPQLQLICDNYNMRWAGDNLELMTGTSNSSTYTLTAPAGYVITEYSFTFANNGHDTGIELTMDDGAAYITSKNAKTISAEDLTMNTVSFTLKGSNSNGVVLTDFVVTVDKDVVSAPKISTAEKQYWYYITNAATNDGTAYCKGKVIYYDSQMGKLRFGDRNFNAAYIWSFWEGDNGKIAIKNYNNQYFGTAPSGTGNKTSFGVVDDANYIYNINAAHDFFIINDGDTDLHAQSDNKVIVRWGAAAGNASLWRFNEVNMANVAAAVRSTRVQQGKVTTGIGNTDQPIVRSIIRVSGLEGNVTFQGVKGQFAGDNKADVTKVKAYFATNERELFVDPEQKMTWRDENGVQFGTEVELAEDGTFTITGEKTLEVGEHYLWITYDIAETAKEGNTVDASITSYTIDGNEVAEDNGNPQHSVTIFLSEGAVLMPMDKGSLYYRIPAITATKDGRLVVLTDDRKNHNTDLPSHCYLVAQYSDDNGKTWSEPVTVAGTAETGGNYGHGDASIVTDRNTGNIIGIMTSCGTYGHGFFGGTAEQPPLWKTITSTDGGETWSVPVDHTASLFGAACDNEKTKTWKSGFSGSGAALQKRDGTLVSSFVNREANDSQHFYLFMSKDGGESWYVSGTSGTAAADEPKTLERNNGDLAISVRASGYNYHNVTSDNGATWHNPSQTRFNTGITGNACDGEYMVWCSTVEGNEWDIALQTLPNSSSRENVSIALSTDEGETFGSPKTICPRGSAYSATVVLPDGTLGVYYEENGLYGGYTMRFVRFSLDWASNGTYKFTNENPFKPIESVTPATVSTSINEHKIGTFYANDPVNIPDGVKAYAATEELTMEGDGTSVLTLTELEDIIPAHTGVVIRAEKGEHIFTQASTNGIVVNGNMFVGYAGAAEYKEVELESDYATYVLAVEENTAGFYKKESSFNVYKNKAYLQVHTPVAEAPARMRIRFDMTTEIEEATGNDQQPTVIYDLQGRHIINPTKGMYIINGKKIIVK